MNKTIQNFCFCTLALGNRYRLMAKELAEDLEKYSPGTSIIIYTDSPNDFKDCQNIIAFKHYQKSILRCVNDKRFVLEKALSIYPVVIYIDADTRILSSIPDNIQWQPGITSLSKNLLQHMKKYLPESLETCKQLASKLDQPDLLDKAKWIGDSLYVVARDEGKEIDFLKTWEIIVSYLELKGQHINDGNIMGLAVAKIGWNVHNEGFEQLTQITNHLDASFNRPPQTFWDTLKMKVGYHYRLNKARLAALRNFAFYYL
jgi:hypothetical protein